MLYPVVNREEFLACGISLDHHGHIPEDSTEAYLVEKILLNKAVWLPKGKTGQLIGYDPETQIQIGCRLVLSVNSRADAKDVFWVNLEGGENSTLHELNQSGIENAVNHSAHTHMYTILHQTQNGWCIESDSDEKPVALCSNFVFAVEGIVRRGQ